MAPTTRYECKFNLDSLLKIMAAWDVTCSLLDRNKHFGGTYHTNYMAHIPEDVILMFIITMRTSNPFLILKRLNFRPLHRPGKELLDINMHM
jgi:hypothetical protein